MFISLTWRRILGWKLMCPVLVHRLDLDVRWQSYRTNQKSWYMEVIAKKKFQRMLTRGEFTLICLLLDQMVCYAEKFQFRYPALVDDNNISAVFIKPYNINNILIILIIYKVKILHTKAKKVLTLLTNFQLLSAIFFRSIATCTLLLFIDWSHDGKGTRNSVLAPMGGGGRPGWCLRLSLLKNAVVDSG